METDDRFAKPQEEGKKKIHQKTPHTCFFTTPFFSLFPIFQTNDDDNSEEELEYDPSMYPQRVGRQKHLLEIQFHFNDGRRGGGMNRGRGRPRGAGGAVGGGGGGGGGMGRGGPNRRADRSDQLDAGTGALPTDGHQSDERVERLGSGPVVGERGPVVGERGKRIQREPREPRPNDERRDRRPAFVSIPKFQYYCGSLVFFKIYAGNLGDFQSIQRKLA